MPRQAISMAQLGLSVDILKQGHRASNDGNTARRFFEDHETTDLAVRSRCRQTRDVCSGHEGTVDDALSNNNDNFYFTKSGKLLRL